MNTRVKALAAAQSADIRARLEREGVRDPARRGTARRSAARARHAPHGGSPTRRLDADVVLVATGATPARAAARRRPDGERILTWTQLYDLHVAAREAHRRRLGRHRRRVRRRVHLARRRRHARLAAATACCPARTPTPPSCSRTCSRRAACTCCRARGPRARGAPATGWS